MMAIRRELLAIVGGFDPWFDIGGEDWDFILQLEKHHIPIIFNGKAIVFHQVRSFTLRDYWKMGAPRARASIKYGFIVLRDAIAVIFHFISLMLFLIALLMGRLFLSFMLFTPSLLLRLRRALLEIRKGANFTRAICSHLRMYIVYIAYVVEILRHFISKFVHRATTYIKHSQK
jgi:GT2 family glycosyltransferase